ncbi:hypothetical protein D9756_002951 [Leucocoprinus leucothites]|uniref:F-box domain-containing protein n=1 Tax=Leucocoprinus leucothites TaxID=201217 RepID=A0A8H5G6X0_9AGAR|nr:hypothetical protein D9756_002951 [Leucoagaricus leucothites]
MSSSHRSAWEDLPPEVFEQTLAYMDDDSMLTLARVNRFFNYTALDLFLGAKIMNCIFQESKFSNVLYKGLARPKASEGLRLSLRVQQLEHIHFRPSNRSSLSEMQSLKPFIQRISALKSLQLELRETRSDDDAVGFNLARAAAELCDSAVAKGCETLKLERLLSFTRLTKDPYPVSILYAPESSSITRNLFCVHLCGAFLLSPLLTYTSGLLGTYSTTIRRLRFDASTIVVPKLNWDQLFSSLHLPNLETFLFDNLVHTRLASSCLADFLSRHPTITTLRIYCGLLRTHDIALHATKPPVLPNLLKIEGSRGIITWLFRDSSACVNVQEVVIPHVEDPTEVLHSVVGPARNPSDSLKVVIKLNPLLRLWLDWMTKQIEKKDNSLRDVRLVNLTFRFDCSISSLDQKSICCLAQFVALFPTLRHFEAVRPSADATDEVAIAEKNLCDNVFQFCPNLQTFTFSSSDPDSFSV